MLSQPAEKNREALELDHSIAPRASNKSRESNLKTNTFIRTFPNCRTLSLDKKNNSSTVHPISTLDTHTPITMQRQQMASTREAQTREKTKITKHKFLLAQHKPRTNLETEHNTTQPNQTKPSRRQSSFSPMQVPHPTR